MKECCVVYETGFDLYEATCGRGRVCWVVCFVVVVVVVVVCLALLSDSVDSLMICN